MTAKKTGRNDPCPCGSGKKFKQCCSSKEDSRSQVGTYMLIGVLVAIGGIIAFTFTTNSGGGSRQVWDPEHGHYHTVP